MNAAGGDDTAAEAKAAADAFDNYDYDADEEEPEEKEDELAKRWAGIQETLMGIPGIEKAFQVLHLRPKEVEDVVKETFTTYDSDHSGSIEAKELTKFLEDYTKVKVTPEIANQVFHDVDVNSDGLVCRLEFVTILGKTIIDEAKQMEAEMNKRFAEKMAARHQQKQ
uniref:EF-hand domain-containing protein n=1 Tax=Lotharella oceanica TaxID=641309 RepID=A0A7S2TI36_9EUKA